MKPCVFCEIIAGRKDAFTVYEDDEIRAVLDIDPINEGHILILPKVHCSDADELDEGLYLRIQSLARRFVSALKRVYDCDGYTVLQNGGKVSATVGHYHLHVIPRYVRDGFYIMTGGVVYRTNEQIAEKIRKELAVSPKTEDQP